MRSTRAVLAVLLALGGPASAQSPAPPIPSDDARILPVLAAHGMVASQEARATRIGVEILRRGGNAVDAAVAVGFALAVTLPQAGNLGGGGFMMVHLADRHETVAIDYRETAPRAATADMFLAPGGEPDRDASRRGGKAVGVPGTVRGLAEAHRLYGSGTLSLADLIAPAEALARGGIPVAGGLADSLPRSAGLLGRWPSTRKIFFRGDAPCPGATAWCRRISRVRCAPSPKAGRTRSTPARSPRGSRRPCARPAA